MAAPRVVRTLGGMVTTALPSSTSPSIRPVTIIAAVLLAGFGAFSIWVIVTQGYFGFLTLAGREPWALQLLIDLVVSLSFGIGWMAADARKRGAASWPYAIAALFTGSLAILAYCVLRPATPRSST